MTQKITALAGMTNISIGSLEVDSKEGTGQDFQDHLGVLGEVREEILETARIKGHGNQHLSSVEEILQDRANERKRAPIDQYLKFNDIYDLFVNSSDWIRTQNESSNILLVEQWLTGYPDHREQYKPITRQLTSFRKESLNSQQSQQPQQPQALVGSVSLGALKLFSIGAPYLYEHTSEVVGKIMTEHKGFWI